MPMPPISEGDGQANFRFVQSADPEEMVCTIGVSSPLAAPAEIAESLFDAFATSIMGGLSSEVALVGCTLYVQDSGGAIPYESTGAPVAGSVAERTAPPNTAILVRKLTGLGGRHGRGRMYLPGVRYDEVSSAGIIAAGTVTAYNERFADFYELFAEIAGGPILFHADESAATVITSFSVQSRLATQRRRLRP